MTGCARRRGTLSSWHPRTECPDRVARRLWLRSPTSIRTGIALRTERMAFSMPGVRSRGLLPKHATIAFASCRQPASPLWKATCGSMPSILMPICMTSEQCAKVMQPLPPNSYAVSASRSTQAAQTHDSRATGHPRSTLIDDGNSFALDTPDLQRREWPRAAAED